MKPAATFRALLSEGRAALSQSYGINPTVDFDATELLCAATGANRAKIMSELCAEAPPGAAASYRSMLARRMAGEPVQYILGEWSFMGLPFYVGPGALIPRADTECLAEKALAAAKSALAAGNANANANSNSNANSNVNANVNSGERRHSLRILDLCTGTGCLAVYLAHSIPGASVTATDMSETALSYARRNAERNRVGGRVEFLRGDLFDALLRRSSADTLPQGSGADAKLHKDDDAGCFDLIVANPPYIPTQDIECLPPDVQHYEPAAALDGGADGLSFYRRIAQGSRRFLRKEAQLAQLARLARPRPQLLVEVGISQAAPVEALFRAAGFCHVETARDLRGVERVVSFSLPM
jgi:release factor glutamine methyltransferase